MLHPGRGGRNRAGELNPHIFWAALGRKSKSHGLTGGLLTHFTKGENVTHHVDLRALFTLNPTRGHMLNYHDCNCQLDFIMHAEFLPADGSLGDWRTGPSRVDAAGED